MSTDPDTIVPHVNTRPGIVQTLGVFNIVFSLLTLLCLSSTTLWAVLFLKNVPPEQRVTVPVDPQAQPVPPGSKPMIAYNPFMGMNDPTFLKFSYVDAGTGILLNGLMFATGIGLVNRKRWGARWWAYLAWTKILRLFVLWSVYIVAVAPSLSENMARNVVVMIQQQGVARAKLPPVGDLTRVYSIMNLIVAVSIMLFGSIYPATSLWVMSRPGFKAALVGKPAKEPEFP